jgi:hypothetical protein
MNEISNIWIAEYIPVFRPSGQPSAVQNRSRRFCPAFAGMTTQLFSGFSSNPLGLPPRDIDPRQGRIAAKG